MLALPTVEAQLTVLTAGRPVSSLFRAMFVLIVSPFTDRSKDPLSFLRRKEKRNSMAWCVIWLWQLSVVIDFVKFLFLCQSSQCRLIYISGASPFWLSATSTVALTVSIHTTMTPSPNLPLTHLWTRYSIHTEIDRYQNHITCSLHFHLQWQDVHIWKSNTKLL